MRRILISSCALASAALLIAGCGGKPWSEAVQNASPSARLLAAVTRTSDAHTADFAMDIKVSASGLGSEKSADLSGTGSIDFTHQSAQLTMKATSSGGSEEGEMRVVGGKAYLRKDGTWSVSGSDASQTDSLGDGDPTQYLQYLTAVSSDVHVVGTGQLDGDNVTTYAGTIDLHQLMSSSSLSPAQRESLKNALAEVGADIPPLPFTAALDDHGRLRKLTDTLDITVLGVTEHIDTTISYSNFGVAVNITPPPGFENDTTPTTDGSPDTEPPSTVEASAPGDRQVWSDLRNGLTAEKTIYTDNQAYTSDTDELATTEGSLDWGGALHVGVSTRGQVVCLSEMSNTGTTFSIADIASGPNADTYFGTGPCPSTVTDAAIAQMSTKSWDADAPGTDRLVQSDLRNALTVEKVVYTDNQQYTTDLKELGSVDGSLDWRTKLHVYVADALNKGDKNIVCIWELDTTAGKVSSIADVAAGPEAGTYFGETPCPATITGKTLSTWSTSW